MTRGIQLVLAEDYSQALGQRTRDGLVQRFEQGTWTGGVPPFGYQVVNKLLQIDPDEAAVVGWLFAEYLRGVGLKTLTKHLGERGVIHGRKQHWRCTSVRSLVVGNTSFAGVLLDLVAGRR